MRNKTKKNKNKAHNKTKNKHKTRIKNRYKREVKMVPLNNRKTSTPFISKFKHFFSPLNNNNNKKHS